jgi:hypothetical protein
LQLDTGYLKLERALAAAWGAKTAGDDGIIGSEVLFAENESVKLNNESGFYHQRDRNVPKTLMDGMMNQVKSLFNEIGHEASKGLTRFQ